MDTLIQDVKYGRRALVRNPGFTLVTVVPLALGIGANSAIIAVLRQGRREVLSIRPGRSERG